MKKVNITIETNMQGVKGAGSYCVVLEFEGHKREIAAEINNVTNRQLEIIGLIEAVKCLKYSCWLNIQTKSFYLKHAVLDKMLLCWKKNGWKSSKNTDIKNKDLWKALDLELSRHVW